MLVKAQSEVDGSSGSSLLAENVRSNGVQSFGIGIACIALAAMPGRRNGEKQKYEREVTESSLNQATTPLKQQSGRSSVFSDEDWGNIEKLLISANRGNASGERSYMTSSQTARICNEAGDKIADIEKAGKGEWVIRT